MMSVFFVAMKALFGFDHIDWSSALILCAAFAIGTALEDFWEREDQSGP
jgi:hypothetical protein